MSKRTDYTLAFNDKYYIGLDIQKADNELAGTTDPDERKRLEKEIKELEKDVKEKVKIMEDSSAKIYDLMALRDVKDDAYDDYIDPTEKIQELTTQLNADDNLITETTTEIGNVKLHLSGLKLGLQTLKDEEDTAHDEYKEWLKQLKQALQDDDDDKDDDKKDDSSDDSDDPDHLVYYDYGELVEEDTFELGRDIACVKPILCSKAVGNFMSQMFGDERRLFDVVDDQYCNEPDIVEAWGAGNDFAAFLDDDDDLGCIIAEAEDLLDTTASRTRYLRGLAELTADGLGDQLLAKEKDCGLSEEEIECMDQWRCNIEEKCVEEILNGEDHCFGILDYVTSCYIWCVGIL